MKPSQSHKNLHSILKLSDQTFYKTQFRVSRFLPLSFCPFPFYPSTSYTKRYVAIHKELISAMHYAKNNLSIIV